jgi:hypothetical protein
MDAIPPQYQAGVSVYCAPNEMRYHLHPELVDEKIENGSTTAQCWLCESCNNGVMTDKIPKMSIAAGVDFGCPSRLGLPSLTLTEEYLIAQGRMLISIIKLVGSKPSSRNLQFTSAIQPILKI